MKKVIVGILCVVLLLLSVSFVGAFQNEPEGFRGLKWGDPPAENMEYVTTIGLVDMYKLPGDKMSIGNAKFWYISYSFYDGRFMGVGLFFKGKENYKLLETICKGRFGEDEVDEGFYMLTWCGQTSFVTLKYDVVEEEGILDLASTQITKEWMNAKKGKESKEAEGDW